MLNFDERTGPDFGEDSPAYPSLTIPDWYRDAKLGIFIHYGIYSVPAFARLHKGRHVPVEHAYSEHQYAEWYGNTVRIPDSPTRKFHEETYGIGTSYEDLADHWTAERFDARQMISDVLVSGAKYVVPVSKHHDGFCLWDTETTPFKATKRGPRRDLISELHSATRAAGARFGLYFSGALDWHVSDLPPIQSDRDLFLYRRNDIDFTRYSNRQVRELIDRFCPDILWNDIDWPDAGKKAGADSLAALWDHYLDRVPAGIINDRWGSPTKGYSTREYSEIVGIQEQPFEACRGLGFSFGYNHTEDENSSMTGRQTIQYLVEVVSKNGNLLLNVGPRGDGTIPELQLEALRDLGQWLQVNGDGIFGSRPWLRDSDAADQVRYTTKGGRLYCFLDPRASITLTLPPEVSEATTVEWLGAGETPVFEGSTDVPEPLRSSALVTASVEWPDGRFN